MRSFHVDRVHARGLDADRDLAVAGDRVGDLDQVQDLGSAELGVDDCAGHGRGNRAGRARYSRSAFWIRCGDTGSAVPSDCANRLTRYSSSSQRACDERGARVRGRAAVTPPASA